jgi:6-phosphogluconolactonase (cycloisomerase 2 family)
VRSKILVGLVGAAFGLGAGSASASQGVYVTNLGGTTGISQYTLSSGGALSADTPAKASGGSEPTAVAEAPNGRYLYVANNGTGGAAGLSQYTIGSGGVLSADSPAAVSSVGEPTAVAVSPNGSYVYAVGGGGGTGSVSQYTVGAGGTLSADTPASVSTTGDDAVGLAVSPNGEYVYVTNQGSDVITRFTVAADGTLTDAATATSTDLDDPSGIALSPDGSHLYVTNYVGGVGVVDYAVGSGGALSTPTTVSAGDDPTAIAVSPNGLDVYVLNSGSTGIDAVEQYTLGSNGQLSQDSPAQVDSGGAPRGIAVSPDGQYVYVSSYTNDSVLKYTVGAGGALTEDTTAVATGLDEPEGLVVAPDAGPLAAFTATPAQSGSASAFVSQATDSDEAIATQTWSFGDGSSATGASVNHTYASPGTYTVTLTVSDAANCSTGFPFFGGQAGPFTGLTSYCSADPGATTSQTVTIAAPPGTGTVVPPPVTAVDGTARISKVTIKEPKLLGTVACSGNSTQICKGTLTLTALEHRTGNKIVAVTASTKPRKTTRTVTLGRATYSLTGGKSKTLTITLNSTGKSLLKSHRKLPAKLTLTVNGISRATSRTVTIKRVVPKRHA